MKIFRFLITLLLGVFLGGGVLFWCMRPQAHEATFDLAAVCEARGGAWVYGAKEPLCMTPEEGLLVFRDGSFEGKTNGTDNEQRAATDDPWKQSSQPPLAGKNLGEENSDLQTENNGGRENKVQTQQTEPAEKASCEVRAVEPYKGSVAAVDFSSWPDASKYKTAITKDVARGANFAGSYVVSTWGCAKNRRATACVGHAIVDVRTGEIVLYDVLGKRTGDFSRDSNLFSVTLQSGEEKTWSVESGELVECGE